MTGLEAAVAAAKFIQGAVEVYQFVESLAHPEPAIIEPLPT
jgi:hypothetical protein